MTLIVSGCEPSRCHYRLYAYWQPQLLVGRHVLRRAEAAIDLGPHRSALRRLWRDIDGSSMQGVSDLTWVPTWCAIGTGRRRRPSRVASAHDVYIQRGRYLESVPTSLQHRQRGTESTVLISTSTSSPLPYGISRCGLRPQSCSAPL